METRTIEIFSKSIRYYPANIYLFKANNRNTRKQCKIYSGLTIKTRRCLGRRSGVVIVNIFQTFF